MKKVLSVLLAVCASVGSMAAVSPYEWEKERQRYTLADEEAKRTEYILKSHLQYQYALEDDQFLVYTTFHRIIYVNSDEAIQKHNRIFIPMYNTLDLVALKARAINKSGKVVHFDISNLKELKNEDGDKSYRIFAMEGVEMGSEIEYFFTRKMYGSLFDRAFTQAEVAIKSSSFMLSCPSHLKFDFKSYNGYPEVTREEGEEQNVYKVKMENVGPIKEEAFAHVDANRKRIEFKLAYNTARSKARLYTWEDAGKNFYSRLTTVSKEEEKSIEKFYKTLGDNPADKIEHRIFQIERKIKTSIQVDKDNSGGDLRDLASIVKYKVASSEGITRLFVALFRRANISAHPVVTCNRENSKFDGKFDTWGYLDDYLLFFPDTKGFIAPYHPETRYPFVPHEFTAHQGLFIEPFAVGGVNSAIASVKEIPAIESSRNADNLDIQVSFHDDLGGNTIKVKRFFSGYNAGFFTPYYPLMTKEDIQRMVDDLVKQTAPDAEFKTWKAEPVMKDIVEDFIIDVEYNSAHFLEKAGPRLIFKVGDLIGSQTEMYRDDQRTLDVENDFNRMYDRIIKVKLPFGYTVKNPQDLAFDVQFKDGDKVPFAFISTYDISGDLITVKITEFYKQIAVPLARYEDFRKVVNAAADFNKVRLLLEKKSN